MAVTICFSIFASFFLMLTVSSEMKELNYESPTLEIICMEAQHCFATSGPVSSQVGLDDLDAVDADWN